MQSGMQSGMQIALQKFASKKKSRMNITVLLEFPVPRRRGRLAR